MSTSFTPVYGQNPTTGKQEAIQTDGNQHLQFFAAAGSSVAINDNAVQTQHWKIDSTLAGRISLAAQVNATSASVTGAVNTANTATISGVAGQLVYITGFSITTPGGTGAASALATISPIQGAGTLSYEVGAAANNPIQVHVIFPSPIPCNTLGAGVTLTLPALGANTGATAISLYGFTQ